MTMLNTVVASRTVSVRWASAFLRLGVIGMAGAEARLPYSKLATCSI